MELIIFAWFSNREGQRLRALSTRAQATPLCSVRQLPLAKALRDQILATPEGNYQSKMSEILSTAVSTEDVPGTPKVSRASRHRSSESERQGGSEICYCLPATRKGHICDLSRVAGLFDLWRKWRRARVLEQP